MAKGQGMKKKVKRIVSTGVAHIQATFNNTIITITDPEGNVITWSVPAPRGSKGRERVRLLQPRLQPRTLRRRRLSRASDPSMCMSKDRAPGGNQRFDLCKPPD